MRPPRATVAVVAAALALAGASPATAASLPGELEDDYATALALARAEGKLLFVDAWAPW